VTCSVFCTFSYHTQLTHTSRYGVLYKIIEMSAKCEGCACLHVSRVWWWWWWLPPKNVGM